jgi:hypothetical protein
MGRQVEFYFTDRDELEFLRQVRSFLPLAWARAVSPTATTEPLDDLPPLSDRSDNVNLVLFNPKLPGALLIDHIPSRSLFAVNIMDSEAVQFLRCTSPRGWLVAGRVWFEPRSAHGPKSPAFLAWADQLMVWMRRSYARHTDGRLLGRNALSLSSSGELRVGPPE